MAIAGPTSAQNDPTATTTDPTAGTTDTTAAKPASPADCALPEALRETKRNEEAIRAYVRVLRTDPSSACAREGLLAIARAATPDVDPCEVAENLHAGESDDIAATVLEEAIKRETACGDGQSASALLKDINEEPLPDRVTGGLTSLGKLLAALLIALTVVAVCALAIPRVRRRLRAALGTTSIVFDAFGDPSSGPKAGAAVTALTAAAFAVPPSDDLAELPLGQVDEHMELATAAEGLDEISPQLAPVTGLLKLVDRIVRPVRLTVSGQLLAATSTGAGLAIKLADTGRTAGSAVLRSGPVDKPTEATEADFERVAGPTAAWIRHRAASIVGADTDSMRTTALSYAWLCAGNAAQERGELDVAVELFDRSIEADPTHLRAKAARALLQAELATIDVSLVILDQALEELEAAGVS